jgi:predicted DCC family thiol-disulfide oxidoreductase YuxK
LVSLSEAKAVNAAAGLSPEALREAIHCVTPSGEVCRAARCLRRIGMRVPLLAPLAWILWLPGVLPLAERGYRWISRNRYALSRMPCGRQTCATPPRENP